MAEQKVLIDGMQGELKRRLQKGIFLQTHELGITVYPFIQYIFSLNFLSLSGCRSSGIKIDMVHVPLEDMKLSSGGGRQFK